MHFPSRYREPSSKAYKNLIHSFIPQRHQSGTECHLTYINNHNTSIGSTITRPLASRVGPRQALVGFLFLFNLSIQRLREVLEVFSSLVFGKCPATWDYSFTGNIANACSEYRHILILPNWLLLIPILLEWQDDNACSKYRHILIQPDYPSSYRFKSNSRTIKG